MIQWKNFERETATDKVNMMKLKDKLNILGVQHIVLLMDME